MSGALKAKIIVVVVLLALTAALVGTCIAYRNRACEHTSLEHIEAVEPTCTESGNIEHWACKRCGATFKDEAGTEEIGRVVRTALGHDLTRHSAVEPTCTEAGNVEYWECERCGVIFADSAATKPLDDHIVAASGHDWNEPVWNWSDDYSKATAYFVCNKDSEHVESVTAKVTISSASATCTGSGRITYLAKAELDGKTYSDSEVVQSGALGHDWTVSEWIWSNDHTSVTAKFVCSRDPSHTREVTETEIVVNEDPATCLADGKTEYSVEIAFDGNTYSDTAVVTLPATGHNWSAPEWTWNGDYSEATATFTCLNDPLHTETVNAVVSILSSSATCTEPGNTEYKAELSFNENVYTDSQSVSGEALGHDWTVSEWIWSKDYTSVTAKFVCSRDNSHTRAISGQIKEDVIKPVSCTEDGESTFTATVSLDGDNYTDQKASVVIKAEGHVFFENWSADDVYHWHKCTVCGEKPDLSTHELVDFTCSVCHQTIFYTEGLEYTLSGDGESYLVSGIGTATDRDIKIMPRYDGKPVTGIADNAFKSNTKIDSVLIPDGVESIGAYAFYGCGYLKTVVIPGSVKSIGSYAFYNSSRIERVDYSGDITGWLNIEGLIYLMSYVSSSCELYIGGTKVEGDIVIPDGVTSIAGSAFRNLQGITSLTIPDSVTSIGEYAFSGCSGITRVDYSGDISGWLNIEGLDDLMKYVSSSCELYIGGTKVEGDIIIPEGVTSIPDAAFIYQTGITSVTIPDSVTSIGRYAFYDCSGLTSVTIGNGVKSIGDYAFCGCSSLTEVTIGNGVKSIGNSAFSGCRGLQSVTIGNDVTSIGQFAFQNCSGLTSVTIPDSVTSIGWNAFLFCSSITRIDYSGDISGWLNISGLNYLMDYVSSSCELYISGTKVEELVIPDGVTSIPDSAFQNLAGITSVTIPDSVTSIGSSAFNNCSGLQSVTIGNGVTDIGEYAFYGCSGLTSVTIPDSVTSIGRSAFEGCINLIQKVDGVGYVDKWVVDCDSSVTGANIRSDTVGIADRAFYDCTTLKSVTIPDSVTSIGDDAFSGCTALSTLKWNAVNVSGFNSPNYVFSGAGTGGNGISVTFGDSVESIPYNLFNTESYTTYPKIAGIKVGNNVKSIGFNAFRSVSSVSSVIIPVSVESIGGYAFNDIDTIYCEAQIKPTYWNDYWADSSINVIWGYDNQDSAEFSYIVKDNKAYITKYKGSGTEVTIPDTLSGYKVVSFGEIFKNNTKITKVVIGNNVTSVFPYAFYGCSRLTSVTIPDSVTSIGSSAFSGCSGLKTVTIGNGVTSIESYVFEDCSSLTSVTIPDSVTSIEHYAFRGCSGLTEVTIGNGVTSIGESAFKDCSSLTSLTIPDSVTSIVWNAFSGCSGLKSVIIGNGVTSIGESAFKDCRSLQSVTIGNGVKGIGINTFYNTFYVYYSITKVVYSGDITGWLNISGLYNLMNHVSSSCELYIGGKKVEGDIIIPEGVSSITGAFANLSAITSVKIPDSVTSIGSSAFRDCRRLQSVTIGNGVKSIGSYAFRNCSSLTSITIPDSVTSMYWNAFSGCRGLKTVTIGNGVKSIGNRAFENFSLTEVTIGNGVTSIGSSAFEGCSGLTSVTIPDSVTTIGSYAFQNCRSLTEVTIPDSVTSIEQSTFYGCSGLQSVTIGTGVTSIGGLAFYNCSSITRIDYSGDIKGWLNIEGLVNLMDYVSSRCELYLDGAKVEGEIIIPEGVTSIPSYAFQNLTGITSVTIPDSVTSIGWYAFYNCSRLTSVTISDSVTSIGRYAFYNCTGLTEINWNAVSVVDFNSTDNVFFNAGTAGDGIEVTFGESVEKLPAYLFYVFYENDSSYRPNIKSVTIGNAVNSIGYGAFSGCSGIIRIDYSGDISGWLNIKGLNYLMEDVSSSLELYIGGTKVEELVIPDGVTSIHSYAFRYQTGITSVTIPDSVTIIGTSAFYNCSSLQSVTMGNGVTSIGTYAFQNCNGITRVDYSGDISGWLNISGLYNLMDCVSSSCELYFGGTKVEELVIPDGVTSIPGSAFRNLTGITSVTISDSVKSIGQSTFYGCSGLQSVTIGTGVTSIGFAAFYNCSSLTSVTIPDSVTSIGSYAFEGCINLIQKDNGVGYVDKWVVDCDSSVTAANIRNDTVGIAGSAFSGCKTLQSVTIPDSVKSIGGEAFSGCSSLTEVTIPDSVTSIGRYAFSGCSSLTSVTIPDSVTSIGFAAFNNCSSLTSATFKNTSGWSAGSTSLSSGNLADEYTAAQYLRSTYASATWTRR